MTQQPNYRLIVLDLDGTLTNSDKQITPRTFAALMDAQRQGVRLVLASGRPTFGIAPLADQLGMAAHDGYILSYNGGEIISWATKASIRKQLLPSELLPTIVEAARRDHQGILSYRGEEIITEEPDDKYVLEEARINKMPVARVDDFLSALPTDVPKCLIVGAPERLVGTEQRLKEDVGERLSVYRSAPFFIEVVPQGIDKAASLDVLLAHLGMARRDMMALGDGWNDASMIEAAGCGVAMANAQEPVKAIADYVTTADNDHDGVAEALEKLLW